MTKIHKNINIDEEIKVLWFHNRVEKQQFTYPMFLLIPKFKNYTKLLSYTIRIENKSKFQLKNISSISECEIDFSMKSVYMKSMGQRVKLDDKNLLQFGEDAGFSEIDKFWAFYEAMYNDIILKDDNFTAEFLVVYCV